MTGPGPAQNRVRILEQEDEQTQVQRHPELEQSAEQVRITFTTLDDDPSCSDYVNAILEFVDIIEFAARTFEHELADTDWRKDCDWRLFSGFQRIRHFMDGDFSEFFKPPHAPPDDFVAKFTGKENLTKTIGNRLIGTETTLYDIRALMRRIIPNEAQPAKDNIIHVIELAAEKLRQFRNHKCSEDIQSLDELYAKPEIEKPKGSFMDLVYGLSAEYISAAETEVHFRTKHPDETPTEEEFESTKLAAYEYWTKRSALYRKAEQADDQITIERMREEDDKRTKPTLKFLEKHGSWFDKGGPSIFANKEQGSSQDRAVVSRATNSSDDSATASKSYIPDCVLF